MGKSFSDELGRNVNRSTREKTFVIRGVVEAVAVAVPELVVAAGAFSFSFPLAVADVNARKNIWLSLAGWGEVRAVLGPAISCSAARLAGC